jgi:hypothetical protein
VTIKHPRSVFLSPTKVARMSFSSVEGRLFEDSVHLPHPSEQGPQSESAGSPAASSAAAASIPTLEAHPLLTDSYAPQPALAAHEASNAAAPAEPVLPFTSQCGFAPTSRGDSASSAATQTAGGDNSSPELVDVLRGTHARQASKLTAALERLGTSQHPVDIADPLAIAGDASAAGAVASGGEHSLTEAEYVMVETSGELAQNGNPSGSLGSLKDGLLARFMRLHSPSST